MVSCNLLPIIVQILHYCTALLFSPTPSVFNGFEIYLAITRYSAGAYTILCNRHYCMTEKMTYRTAHTVKSKWTTESLKQIHGLVE